MVDLRVQRVRFDEKINTIDNIDYIFVFYEYLVVTSILCGFFGMCVKHIKPKYYQQNPIILTKRLPFVTGKQSPRKVV